MDLHDQLVAEIRKAPNNVEILRAYRSLMDQNIAEREDTVQRLADATRTIRQKNEMIESLKARIGELSGEPSQLLNSRHRRRWN